MTSGDSEIAREWFAEKPSHIAGQLELGSPNLPTGSTGARDQWDATSANGPGRRRSLTAAEVVQQYFHTTTHRGTDEHQPAPEGRD